MAPAVPPLVSHDISISEANLIGIWAEGPLYGLTLALYVCYIRLFAHESRNLHKTVLLAIAIFQVFLATAHYVADLADLILGFVIHVDGPDGPNGYFNMQSRVAYDIAFFFWATNYVIGDAMMGWRCYIVWGRNPFIGCFYVILLIGQTAMAYTNFVLITTSRRAASIFAADGVDLAVTLFSLSMCVQVSATALITYKILRTSRWRAMSNAAARRAAVWTVVESGAVLTGATACVLALFVLRFEAGAVMNPVITQLSFLVPTSIFVRARMKQAGQGHKTTPVLGMERKDGIAARGSPDVHSSSDNNTDMITIALSTTVESDAKVDGTTSISSKV